MKSGLSVAVTGACGYLGQPLCRQLATHPSVGRVIGLDREPWPVADEVLAADRFRSVRIDIADPTVDLAGVFAGVDVVCHLAFLIESDFTDDVATRVNIGGSWAVLRAAARAGVRHLVVASSISAYGALPDNPVAPRGLSEDHPLRARPTLRYAFHKVLVEQMIESFLAESGRPPLDVARLRISTVTGPPPRQGAVMDLLSAPVLALPRSFRVQLVHRDDVAAAFVAAIERGAVGAFNVAAGPPLSARRIAEITGQRFIPLPGFLLPVAARALALTPARDPGRLEFISHPIIVDTRRLRDELGWVPHHDGEGCLRALFA